MAPVNAANRVAAIDDGSAQKQRQETDVKKPSTAERKALQAAADQLNEHYMLRHAELHFHVDEESKRLVVTILDARDGTLIRQLPSEEALRLARALQNENETPALLKQIA
ncbi:flagellar protein FlaG [Hydrocarboniphaga sp.]|uniref:flagellar protein FlaG n=1 Tax=Hydrocarboniphaga sp. TaxID=2033016 RepID=UPI00261951DF|nr:flagellar protein FlaG [Hydrocarboniphaga sp.]